MKQFVIRKFLVDKDIFAFDWDEGNKYKNEKKHNVKFKETEEIFSDKPVYFRDNAHSAQEIRWYAIGFSEKDRILKIVFTYRKEKIRVISARAASKKERKIYYSVY